MGLRLIGLAAVPFAHQAFESSKEFSKRNFTTDTGRF
jgi:hypothetical protein